MASAGADESAAGGRDTARDVPRLDGITIDGDAADWGERGFRIELLTSADLKMLPAEDLDADGWRLRDADHWMLLAHDMNDALAVLRLVERHSRMCFIGRDNTRPNRKHYIMTYWE